MLAPELIKEPINWQVYEKGDFLAAVLTAESLWDWLYIDMLWVHEDFRGAGF